MHKAKNPAKKSTVTPILDPTTSNNPQVPLDSITKPSASTSSRTGRSLDNIWGDFARGDSTSGNTPFYPATCLHCDTNFKYGKPHELRAHIAYDCKGLVPPERRRLAQLAIETKKAEKREKQIGAHDIQDTLALVWSRPGHFDTVTKPLPLIQAHEAKIRVLSAGLCGTDIHIFHGDLPDAVQGCTIGHEFCGRVIEIGATVTNIKVDDLIVVDPNIPCQNCNSCRVIGKPNLCTNPTAMGVSRDGGMATYCVIPAIQAYIVPEHIPIEVASLAEPLSCAIHAVDFANPKPGKRALVIGAGTMGVLCASLLHMNCAQVVVSDSSPSRCTRVSKFGCSPLMPMEIPSDSFDIVIECAGSAEAQVAALDAVARGGTVIWAGVLKPSETVQLKTFEMYRKEITIRAARMNPFTMGRSIELLASNKIKWADLVTGIFTLADFPLAWAAHKSGEGLKICINP